jgi:hypothetical protein
MADAADLPGLLDVDVHERPGSAVLDHLSAIMYEQTGGIEDHAVTFPYPTPGMVQ